MPFESSVLEASISLLPETTLIEIRGNWTASLRETWKYAFLLSDYKGGALSMRVLLRMMFPFVFCAQFSLNGFAQSGIIDTFDRSGSPLNVPLAATEPLDHPRSIALDGVGGFYVSSEHKNRIYHVTADGRFRVAAGVGIVGYSGDGGQAKSAQLIRPYGVAVDSTGNLYIADTGKNRIRKVTPAGVITTIAGNGNNGYSGDDGPAASAILRGPTNVAMDSAGNLYIADTGNNRIRKVTPAGVITTIVGNGEKGCNGDGGPASLAQLYWPHSVAVDSGGNLYVSDTHNNRIRKVTSAGVIATIAGNGTDGFSGDDGPAASAKLSMPECITVDSAGNLYIADRRNHRVRKVTPAGMITTIAGNGTYGSGGDGGWATSAQLETPYGLAMDSAGNLYISDSENRVRKVTPGGLITTVAGGLILALDSVMITNAAEMSNFIRDGGPATSARINHPTGIAVDFTGNLYIADSGNHRIREVTPAGLITTVAGTGNVMSLYSGDGGQATSAKLYNPSGVSVDSVGNLYIADTKNYRIRKVNPVGVITTVVRRTGIYVSSVDDGRAVSAQLASPQGVAVDSAGNLYIADMDIVGIRKVTPAGVITTVAGTQKGHFSRAMQVLGEVVSGDKIYTIGDGSQDLALDSAGNLYIADTSHYRIRKVTPKGKITTIAGNGEKGYSGDGGKATQSQLGPSFGVAVDSSGNVYIADTYNSRIRKVTHAGMITTIAGNGNNGFSGDGGQATSAQLSWPRSVAVDSAGNLYIADTQNNRIRKVTPAGLITTVAGNGDEGYDGDDDPAVSVR
jgi:sugar lactone lactonase YvrE